MLVIVMLVMHVVQWYQPSARQGSLESFNRSRSGSTPPGPTVRFRGMETGISEASKRVSIFSFATLGGKQASFHFREWNWVQAREAQIRFPAG